MNVGTELAAPINVDPELVPFFEQSKRDNPVQRNESPDRLMMYYYARANTRRCRNGSIPRFTPYTRPRAAVSSNRPTRASAQRCYGRYLGHEHLCGDVGIVEIDPGQKEEIRSTRICKRYRQGDPLANRDLIIVGAGYKQAQRGQGPVAMKVSLDCLWRAKNMHI